MLFDQDFLENPDVFFSTYFSKAGGKSDIISFMVCYINTYRTKLFPYLKNIDSNFMKLISRYRFEKP